MHNPRGRAHEVSNGVCFANHFVSDPEGRGINHFRLNKWARNKKGCRKHPGTPYYTQLVQRPLRLRTFYKDKFICLLFVFQLPYRTYHAEIIIPLCVENFIHGRFILHINIKIFLTTSFREQNHCNKTSKYLLMF